MFFYAIRWLLRVFLRPLWLEQIKGRTHLPATGPYIIAANHSSYLDFMGIVIACPSRVTFLAAEKFYNHPLWKWIMVGTGQIRVDRGGGRGKSAYQKAIEVLESGGIIGIFPEGTRSASGEIQHAFPGVARMALETGVPVVPAGIKGAYEILSRDTPFPRFDKTYSIEFGEPIIVTQRPEQLQDEKKVEELLVMIMDRIHHLSASSTK